MNFKEWLMQNEGGWISKGKAQVSLLKPGPRDAGPKPHDVGKLCGAGGGPGPCQGGGSTAPAAAPAPKA